MRRTFLRLLTALFAASLLASACGGGGGLEGLADPEQKATDVKAPDVVDSKATALPGLLLQTNSPSMRRLADSPSGAGAVVVFIQPGGPSFNKGIARGDLLTEVDGKTVANQETALAQLRSRPSTDHELTFKRRDGSTRTIEITTRNPGRVSTFSYVNPEVQQNPSDALLRFLRAQTESKLSDKTADLRAALNTDPKFVEAITLQASITWDRRRAKGVSREEKTRLANAALAGWTNALDLDPNNTTALSVRSTTWSELGNGRRGLKDAELARKADETYPRAYYALAIAQLALNKPELAAAPALSAIKLNPYYTPYYDVLARVFARLKRKDDCNKTADAIGPFLIAQNRQFGEANVRFIKNRCK